MSYFLRQILLRLPWEPFLIFAVVLIVLAAIVDLLGSTEGGFNLLMIGVSLLALSLGISSDQRMQAMANLEFRKTLATMRHHMGLTQDAVGQNVQASLELKEWVDPKLSKEYKDVRNQLDEFMRKKMKPIIVKIGGSLLGGGDTCLEDMVALQRKGLPLVVVHGGGKALTEWQGRLGLKAQFVRGLRVTDKDSLPVVVAVLAGLVNKELVAQVNSLGGKAVGLSGVDGRLIEAEVEDKELGFVGRVVKVNPELVLVLVQAGYMPFIAPVGLDIKNRGALNINADTVAGEVASALGAKKLIFLSDVPGVLDAQGELIARLDPAGAKSLMASGVIASGMVPKVEACLRAKRDGTLCRLIDGREPHMLLKEMAGEARGTTV